MVERAFRGWCCPAWRRRGATDSVQLAAASVLLASTDEPVVFACFDRRLNQAAQLLRLRTLA